MATLATPSSFAGLAAARWHMGLWHGGSLTATAQSSYPANAMAKFYRTGDKALGITKLGIYSTGTTGDAGVNNLHAGVAIYSHNQSTEYPDTLLAQTGDLDVTTTGIITDAGFTEITLAARTGYWFVTCRTSTKPSNNTGNTSGYLSTQQDRPGPYPSLDSGAFSEYESYAAIDGGAMTPGSMTTPFPSGKNTLRSVQNVGIAFFYLNTVT